MTNVEDNKKKNVHAGHRQRMRQKFIASDGENFCNHELLETLLFYSVPRSNTNELAHRLLSYFGSLERVFEASCDELTMVEGIGESSALLIRNVAQIMRRIHLERRNLKDSLLTPQALGDFFYPLLYGLEREEVYLLLLDNSAKAIDCVRVGVGEVNFSEFDYMGIARLAMVKNASSVVIGHNHPHGSCMPSPADIQANESATRLLSKINIRVDNHIIVGEDGFCSLHESAVSDGSSKVTAEAIYREEFGENIYEIKRPSEKVAASIKGIKTPSGGKKKK